MPLSAVFCAASGPVETTLAVPLPMTVRPAVVASVAVPLVAVSVTSTGAVPASGSATLTVPAKVCAAFTAVVTAAGAVMVGALLFAASVTETCASGALTEMPSSTVTVITRVVVSGASELLW